MVLLRGLMVITKIIQNLANNIFFKEVHMMILNKFLENNIANMTRFLSEMHVCISLFCRIDTFMLKRNRIS